MRTSLFALVAGLALLNQQSAWAKGKGTSTMDESTMKSQTADEPKKHLSEIDVYLRDAMNNTKVLYETTQLLPGKLDMTIQREGITNIDKAVANALTHISHIKSMPEARVSDMPRLDLLQRNLMQSRAMLNELRSAMKSQNKDQLAMVSSQLFAKLKDADDDFGTLAEKQNLVRIDKINVPERQPVGGRTEPGESGTAPSQPGATPPVKAPGTTVPPSGGSNY